MGSVETSPRGGYQPPPPPLKRILYKTSVYSIYCLVSITSFSKPIFLSIILIIILPGNKSKRRKAALAATYGNF